MIDYNKLSMKTFEEVHKYDLSGMVLNDCTFLSAKETLDAVEYWWTLNETFIMQAVLEKVQRIEIESLYRMLKHQHNKIEILTTESPSLEEQIKLKNALEIYSDLQDKIINILESQLELLQKYRTENIEKE